MAQQAPRPVVTTEERSSDQRKRGNMTWAGCLKRGCPTSSEEPVAQQAPRPVLTPEERSSDQKKRGNMTWAGCLRWRCPTPSEEPVAQQALRPVVTTEERSSDQRKRGNMTWETGQLLVVPAADWIYSPAPKDRSHCCSTAQCQVQPDPLPKTTK